MARCSDLPPELIARMMDFHRDAQSTLRQCSLVCRAWTSPSQCRLFRVFTLGIRQFNTFRDLLVGAPHLGTYIREVAFIGPRNYKSDVPEVIDLSDRENLQSLFPLLPNITTVHAFSLWSSPLLFTNSMLRQSQQLRKFVILETLQIGDVVSPASIFPIFSGTTVEELDLYGIEMPSTMDTPLNSNSAVCAVERLSLDRAQNFPVWLPYFQSVNPRLRELNVVVYGPNGIQAWSHSLRTSNLSGLRRFHFHVYIHTTSIPSNPTMHFLHDNASPLFSSAPFDHLLLTVKGERSTLKTLTFTVMALDESTVATAWAKVDDTLSSPTFDSLEHVHFLDDAEEPISAGSNPNTVRMLQQVLPKLSRKGKLAV
ncbi:hypothetical protein BDZ89DRAFT_1066783 [Hymenopellis radicata]|nr:hypothetical protein BDZ89DRAFT_1066783 [Hymenopellis radicata]